MRADDQRFCDHCGSAYTQLPKANRRQRYCSSLCASRAENKAMKAAPLRAARSRARDRWYRMIDRCANPENDHWHRYGGRGIAVCDRWQDFDAYYTDTYVSPRGWRECRACHREKQARRRAAIKEGSSAA